MNRIRVKRLILSGIVTLLVFIAVEILVEFVIGRAIFGESMEDWVQTLAVPSWGVANHVLNIFIALVNSVMLIWLYAALRPMFGVGLKTALIASALALVFGISMAVNGANLGLYPIQIALLELGYELIELPIAVIIGALVYEGE